MTEEYKELCVELKSLTENERHIIPDLANASALIWQKLERINWAGFYIADKEGLEAFVRILEKACDW